MQLQVPCHSLLFHKHGQWVMQAPEINPLVTGPSSPKQARKDRGPNWSPQEIAILITARREQYLRELDTVDGRDLVTPDTSKWIHISHFVNTAGFSPIPRDGPAWKTKWNHLVPDYKRIADYLSRTGQNVVDYCSGGSLSVFWYRHLR